MKINILSLLFTALLLSPILGLSNASAQNNCPALPTNTGSVTSSVTITKTGDYKVWSRLQGINTASNSYYLQIDNQCAIVVGDSNSSQSNTWEWIDYRDGRASSSIIMPLTQGSHVIRMIGKESNVKLDKIIFASNLSCMPTGSGTNCGSITTSIPAPTNQPTLRPTNATVSQPTKGAQSITSFTLINAETNKPITGYENIPSGSFTLNLNSLPTRKLNFRANTSPSKVGSIRFTYDGSQRNTESSAPYAFAGDDDNNYSDWTPSIGIHTITATPYTQSDARGTKGTAYNLNLTITAGTQGEIKDIEPPTISILSPAHNIKVSAGSKITLSAGATDNRGITNVDFSVTGGSAPFKCSDNSPSYGCIWTVPSSSGTYTITTKSYDAANNTPGIQVIQVRAE